MKHPKRKTLVTKKNLIIACAAALLVVGSVVGFIYTNNDKRQTANTNDIAQEQRDQNPENNVNYDPPTEAEIAETEQQKEEIVQENETPPAAGLTVTITRSGQTGTGQPLNIRTLVTGATSGTCNVSITKIGQTTLTKTFPITFDATYSSCEGANVPASEFTAEGSWQVSITATNGANTSAPATTTVNIEALWHNQQPRSPNGYSY
jgi:hypothetical protein